jgi:hypothetical protein
MRRLGVITSSEWIGDTVSCEDGKFLETISRFQYSQSLEFRYCLFLLRPSRCQVLSAYHYLIDEQNLMSIGLDMKGGSEKIVSIGGALRT